MGADNATKNTPYAPPKISPICLPKSKSLGFSKKRSLWVSVVRAAYHIWVGDSGAQDLCREHFHIHARHFYWSFSYSNAFEYITKYIWYRTDKKQKRDLRNIYVFVLFSVSLVVKFSTTGFKISSSLSLNRTSPKKKEFSFKYSAIELLSLTHFYIHARQFYRSFPYSNAFECIYKKIFLTS